MTTINPSPPRPVLAITGAGGIGLACARRLARNRVIHIGDISSTALENAAASLRGDGHEVHTHVVDVASFPSVMKFAQSASETGYIETIVHTAGLSPVMATPQRILEVDLLGTANVIEAFYEVLGTGMGTGPAMVAISSVARFGVPLGSLSPGMVKHLATSSLDSLSSSLVLELPGPGREDSQPSEIQSEIRSIIFGTTTTTTTTSKDGQEDKEPTYSQKTAAYSLSKQANYLRVQAASQKWFLTRAGARINTVSPGIVLTAMTRREEAQQLGPIVQQMIDSTPMRRGGSANEIASAVAFLAGPDASYVTGTDLLVDGGFLASNGGGFEIPPGSGEDEEGEEGKGGK